MKKMIRLAAIAAAALTITACTQEELVVQLADQTTEQTPMGFSARVPNMTRAVTQGTTSALGTDQTFGVYCLKSTTTSGTTLVMNNYKVQYGATSGGSTWGEDPATPDYTDHKSQWYYDGLTKASDNTYEDQELQYWEDDASRYDFYAYLGYNKSIPYTTGSVSELYWYHSSNNTLTYVLEAASSDEGATSAEPTVMLAYAGMAAPFTHNDVSFNFKHINGKVNLRFYTDLLGYNVDISSISLTANESTDKINTKSQAQFQKENGIVVTAKNVATGFSQTFTSPTSTSTHLPQVSSPQTYLTSPTTYYCMPASTVSDSENGDLKLTVTYTLTPTAGGTTVTKTKSVKIPAAATQRLQNTAYVYTFKIGGRIPIVFDGITVSGYDTDASEYTISNED